MRAHTIAKLAMYRPRSSAVAGLYTCTDIAGLSAEQAAEIMHYAECHADLQFGWHFAVDMADSNTPFPAFLRGDDLYVWRAYNYIKGGEDTAIAGAVALTTRGNKQIENTIKALLIADDVTCEYVAKKLSIPVDVITAYEKLFFNVLDRKKDRAFIASIVYPDGRIKEAMEDYLENTGIGELMLRAGHTHGIRHVLYAAGIEGNPFDKVDVLEGAETMDKKFMAEGLIYAGLGLLNQRKNAMPIHNARLSLQAGKMGKGDTQTVGSAFGFGDTLREELIMVGRQKAEAQLKSEALNVEVVVPINATEQ